LDKAIFLDRDGVLNKVVISKETKKIRPPYSKNELKICYDNIKNLNKIRDKYLFFIITNQPDIKKGLQTEEFNNYINSRILKLISINEICTCFCYEDDRDCFCYKPRPGMIFDMKKKWKIDLKKSFVIGDRWRDIGAGINAGCNTIFIKKNYNKKDLALYKPDFIVNNLDNIIDILS
tara:strand:+ start:102 stop:632 length:531 start_codon:yes stop_codon:yes gene_type:complete